ncbi:hypothetical protein BDZ89DRAFT_387125 [Hymenopellis radicata]|nr:hypothetical protein BDZ89DRAFT_387125 [Hymenopellis radicata]
MVATLSQGIANANNDEKKRTHPIDRARAMHLSRQLQMRLQYAKLKVEHGWTKQRLNEVENLYFHLSHARGGKPPPSSSANLTTTTTTTVILRTFISMIRPRQHQYNPPCPLNLHCPANRRSRPTT